MVTYTPGTDPGPTSGSRPSGRLVILGQGRLPRARQVLQVHTQLPVWCYAGNARESGRTEFRAGLQVVIVYAGPGGRVRHAVAGVSLRAAIPAGPPEGLAAPGLLTGHRFDAFHGLLHHHILITFQRQAADLPSEAGSPQAGPEGTDAAPDAAGPNHPSVLVWHWPKQ